MTKLAWRLIELPQGLRARLPAGADGRGIRNAAKAIYNAHVLGGGADPERRTLEELKQRGILP